MRLIGTILAALLLAPPLAASKAAGPATTHQYVSADTRLLATPSAFGKALRTLKRGTLVKAEAPRNGYAKVSVALGEDKPLVGYLPVRALQKNRPALTTAARRSSDASAEEVAAATKGFNRQIEAELRGASKDQGFARLDQALARGRTQDPLAELEGFRKEGRLGEFKEEGR